MRKSIKAGTLALALVGLLTANAAEAKSKEEAWAARPERAQRIDFALKVQDETVHKAAIKDACTGVTGTIVSQGMQFPMWGQELMGMCRVAKDSWLYGSNKGRYCKDVKRSAKVIGKAEPVPEPPEADRIALDISAVLLAGAGQGRVQVVYPQA